jgi:hypothetical protein
MNSHYLVLFGTTLICACLILGEGWTSIILEGHHLRRLPASVKAQESAALGDDGVLGELAHLELRPLCVVFRLRLVVTDEGTTSPIPTSS